MRHLLILGNGIAGFSAALAIRQTDPAAEITLIGDEPESPCRRPLLSKTFAKTFSRRRLMLAEPGWQNKWQIREISGRRILGLDRKQHRVLLEDGQEICYDRCIYALGAKPFLPPFPGKDLQGVLTLRTAADFAALRSRLVLAEQALVIGGGVIGLEIAWEIRQMGLSVRILEAAPHLMGRLLDPESADFLQKRCEAAGIPVSCGISVQRLCGEKEVCGLQLTDGTFFPAELVLLSCGIRAETDLARAAGLPCGRGLLADRFLQTADPDIYAAGDCLQTEIPNPGLWNYAALSGRVAGYNAARPEDREAESFCPAEEPLLLHACETALYAVGDRTEGPGTETMVQIRTETEPDGKPQFLVNPHNGLLPSFHKEFYREGKLCGAVLIGDLSDMTGIRRRLTKEAF